MNCLCGIFRLCAEIGLTLSQRPGGRRVNPADGLALLQAAQSGDARAVYELLERGVPADGARTRRQETALFLAAENGHVSAVKALLEHGADPSVPNEDGAGAITQAAAAGRVQIIKLMKRYQPWAFSKPAAVLALHQASLGAHSEALQALLDCGAPVDVRLPNRPPVLHEAAISCAICVQILLKAGADPNCTDHQERTALHRAAEADRADCVCVLVAAGAHVDARTFDGRQPWQEAPTASVANLLLGYLQSQRVSQSSLLALGEKRLSTERMREGDSQPVRAAGDAGPSDAASPGDPPRQDASPRPAAGPSGETSPGAPSNQVAPARPSAGPSGVTSPRTSTSSNDAPASAGAVPSGESLPATSSGPVAEASGVTFQTTSSAISAKFSSKEQSE